jgi:hypothetical protein
LIANAALVVESVKWYPLNLSIFDLSQIFSEVIARETNLLPIVRLASRVCTWLRQLTIANPERLAPIMMAAIEENKEEYVSLTVDW